MIRRTIPHLDLAQIAASGQCFTWGRGAAGSWTIPAGERLVTACQRGEELTFSCDMAEFDAFWATAAVRYLSAGSTEAFSAP